MLAVTVAANLTLHYDWEMMAKNTHGYACEVNYSAEGYTIQTSYIS